MMNQEIRSQTEEQGRQKNGDGLFEETKQFEELMMMYDCAIRQVQTKLEILDEEFSVRYRRQKAEKARSGNLCQKHRPESERCGRSPCHLQFHR